MRALQNVARLTWSNERHKYSCIEFEKLKQALIAPVVPTPNNDDVDY